MRESGEYNTAPPVVAERRNIYNEITNYVGPGPQSGAPVGAKMEMLPPFTTQMDVQHPHQGTVVKHTSEVDSAFGFSIRTGVLAGVVALFAMLAVSYFSDEWFTAISLLSFFGAFCVVFVIGWGLDTLKAPEFGALVGALCQWFVIAREQKERWAHYRWQAGRTLPVRPWWVEYKGWIVLGGVVWSVFFVAVIASIVWG